MQSPRPGTVLNLQSEDQQLISIKMKAVIFICFLGVAAVALARPGDEKKDETVQDTYTDKYDNVNLDEVLENRRLLVPYIQCILEKGKCAPDGKELKAHIREALENNCGKCNKAQKNGTQKVIKHLINHEQEFWDELTKKYDPNNHFTKKYEKELREIKA